MAEGLNSSLGSLTSGSFAFQIPEAFSYLGANPAVVNAELTKNLNMAKPKKEACEAVVMDCTLLGSVKASGKHFNSTKCAEGAVDL